MQDTLLAHAEPLGEIDFTEGGRHTIEVNRPGVLGSILLRMQFTVTNGASAAVGPLWGTLASLIKRVEVIVNGKDTIVSIDGPGLVARAIYELGNNPYGMGDTVVLTGSAATAYDIILPIPFYLPKSATPFLTALPVDRLGQTTIAITYGDIDDFYATPNSAAISAVTVEAWGKFLVNVPRDRNFLARVLYTLEEDLAATTTNYQTTINVGTGVKYRSILVVALDDGVAADTIINKLTFQTGQYVFAKWDAPVLQADNKHTFNQATAHQTGVHFVNSEMFGQALWIDTSRNVMSADLQMVLDVTKVTGVNTLRFYQETIRPFQI